MNTWDETNEKNEMMTGVVRFADMLADAAIDAGVISVRGRLQDDTDTMYIASVFEGLSKSLSDWHVTLKEAILACSETEDVEESIVDYTKIDEEVAALQAEQMASAPETPLDGSDLEELFSQDERSMTQIANDAGLTTDTVKRFVEGEGKPRNKTLRGLEKAFNLGEGTLDVFA